MADVAPVERLQNTKYLSLHTKHCSICHRLAVLAMTNYAPPPIRFPVWGLGRTYGVETPK